MAEQELSAERTRLFAEAAELVAQLPGVIRRMALRTGPHEIEIEWQAVDVAQPSAPPPVAAPAQETLADEGVTVVAAPLVGTFYRAPEPGAAPFVEVGDLIEASQTLAIVEAMKLMNTIVAEGPGRVAEICVGDGEPVEFGQPLIRLADVTGDGTR